MRGSIMRSNVTLIPCICVASFPGLLPPSYAILCVRICARPLLTVEGEGLGTCYTALLACARARRTVSHTRRSHAFVAEVLGTPLAEILATPLCDLALLISRQLLISRPHRHFYLVNFNTQNHSCLIFFETAKIFLEPLN